MREIGDPATFFSYVYSQNNFRDVRDGKNLKTCGIRLLEILD